MNERQIGRYTTQRHKGIAEATKYIQRQGEVVIFYWKSCELRLRYEIQQCKLGSKKDIQNEQK